MNAILTEKRGQLDTKIAELRALSESQSPSLEDVKRLTGEIDQLRSDVDTLTRGLETIERDAQVRDVRTFNGKAVAVPGRPNVGAAIVERGAEGIETRLTGEGGIPPEQMEQIRTPEYLRAYDRFLRQRGHVSGAEYRALEAGIDPQGGFLVPPQYINQIIQRRPAPTRVSGRVRRLEASGTSVILPRVTGGDDTYSSNVRIQWTGEAKPAANYTPTAAQEAQFGVSTIPVHEGVITGAISQTLLEDSAFDVLGWITDEIVRAKGLEDDRLALVGTGVGQPRGITVGEGFQAVATIGNDAISPDDLRGLPFEVAEQYVDDAVWVMNRRDLGKRIALMKDAENRYLFSQGVMDSGLVVRPGTNLGGYPVLFSPFMANLADQAVPILFGDLAGYYMVGRTAISIKMLDQTAAKQGLVEFVVRYRQGGELMEPWAVRGLLVQ